MDTSIENRLLDVTPEWIEDLAVRAKNNINDVTEEEVCLALAWIGIQRVQGQKLCIKFNAKNCPFAVKSFFLERKYKGLKVLNNLRRPKRG